MSARPVRALPVAFAFALALAAAGCGGSGTATDASGADAGAGDAAAAPARTDGKTAVPFELADVDGQTFRFEPGDAELTLLDFWATWCAPCREEVPFLKELEDRWGERGFRLVAISDESPEAIREFVEEFGIDYVNLVDAEGDVASAYRVLGLPTGYLVDAEGAILWTMPGRKNEKALEEKIAAALGEDDGAS